MSLQEQPNQLINDPGVRNTRKGKQVLWESIHHTLFCVTPADVVAREQHNTLSAQMYESSIEHVNSHTQTHTHTVASADDRFSAKISKQSFLLGLY